MQKRTSKHLPFNMVFTLRVIKKKQKTGHLVVHPKLFWSEESKPITYFFIKDKIFIYFFFYRFLDKPHEIILIIFNCKCKPQFRTVKEILTHDIRNKFRFILWAKGSIFLYVTQYRINNFYILTVIPVAFCGFRNR